MDTRTNNVDSKHISNVDRSSIVYATLCKNTDYLTVSEILNSIRDGVPHNVIAKNNCVSLHTISHVDNLYRQIGGDSVAKIANKLCGGSISTTDLSIGTIGASTSERRVHKNKPIKSFDDRIDDINKGIVAAEKAVDTAKKVGDLTVGTVTAITGIINALKSDKRKSEPLTHSSRIDAEEVTAHPTTKGEVLKNVEQLAEQLIEKNREISKLKKEVDRLRYTPSDCESGVTKQEYESLQKEMLVAKAENDILKNRNKQLEETIISNREKLEELHKEKINQIARDVAKKKDEICKRQITEMTGSLKTENLNLKAQIIALQNLQQ